MIKMLTGKKLFLVIMLLIFFLGIQRSACAQTQASASEKIVDDSLWADALAAVERGNVEESLRFLRLCLIGNVETPKAENMMSALLASASADLINNRQLEELSESEIITVFKYHEEIANLKKSEAADWLKLLNISLLMKKDDQFILSGLAFLDRIDMGMPVKATDEFVGLIKRLEARLTKEEQVLYRLQIVRILSGIEQTADEYAARLSAVQLEAEAKAIRILGLAEVAMAVGELDTAKKYLDHVRAFDGNYSGLTELYKKLEQARRIQKILAEAAEALRNQQYEEAIKKCNNVMKIDANNIFARNILQQIKEARERKTGKSGSASDLIALKIRRLESDLRKAEKEQDYSQIRQIIKELLLLKSDLQDHRRRLDEIEREITLSRLHADERFKMAVDLYQREEFQQLRFFLNRNPGLMSSMERLFEIWEMRLMANYYTGHLDPLELRSSAAELKKKAKKSFAASYVLMKLAMAENRLEEARIYFDEAREINPKFGGLKWPGWVLWMHGEGRPLVVIVLVLLLFVLVKLIRPAFSWFESTYWRRTALMAKIFPSLALKSLEGCFGVVKELSERERLFRMLISCSISCKDRVRARRYAENLLEIRHEDSQALDVLVPEWMKAADLSDEKLTTICSYCIKNLDQKELFVRAGELLRRSKIIEVGHIEFLRHYIRHMPDDIEMLHLAGKSLLEIPALEMPESAISMIETAWRRTESDELWWSLWRTLMFCGNFDQAIQITIEVLENRRPVKPAALLDVFDKYVMGELRHILDLMSLYDEKKVLAAVKSVKKFRYFNERMAEEALQIIESLAREENHELAGAAREATDHVRSRGKHSIIAVNKFLAMETAMESQTVQAPEPPAENNPAPVSITLDCAREALDEPELNSENNVEDGYFEDESEVACEKFSLETINQFADEESDTFSVGDILSSVSSAKEQYDSIRPSEEVASETIIEPAAEQEDPEALRNSQEQGRICEMRQKLFAELDSIQPLQETSEDWKSCNRFPVKNNGLFAVLDD